MTTFSLSATFPKVHKGTEFDKKIADLSPKFVSIFDQASIAESNNLSEICGMGYRRSLEFLIKDYIIQVLGIDEATVKSTFLGKCINTYIDNRMIKEMAERAAWLGNDETHYERVWENKDVSDLKKLIEMVVYHISMDFGHREYMADMPERKK